MIISALNKLYLSARRIIANAQPITILRYHSISNISDPYSISPEAFRLQAEFISEHYNISRLNQLKDAFSLHNNNLAQRKVVFTFDDAYSDFFDIAHPI